MVERIEGALVPLRTTPPLGLSSLPVLVQLGSAASGTALLLLMPAQPRLPEEGSFCHYPGRLFVFGIIRKQRETWKCRHCILRHGGIQETVCACSVLEPDLAVQGYSWLFDFLPSESNKEEPLVLAVQFGPGMLAPCAAEPPLQRCGAGMASTAR